MGQKSWLSFNHLFSMKHRGPEVDLASSPDLVFLWSGASLGVAAVALPRPIRFPHVHQSLKTLTCTTSACEYYFFIALKTVQRAG